jgi:hypothetical protein
MASLQRPIVSNQHVLNAPGHWEAIALSWLKPHQLARCVMVARIELRTDKFQGKVKSLYAVDAAGSYS